MSGTLLRRTALLLTVIAMLSGCEEVAAPKPVSKPPPDERPAQLYTEIGADELLERWAVLPNGAVAEAVANPSGRRLAAATDGFSGLPKTFRFSDAREYGACVVFTIERELGEPGQPGPPGEPGQPGQAPPGEPGRLGERRGAAVEYEASRVYEEHVIDCVGNPHEKNPVEGLFHAAHLCSLSGFFHILRAGNFDPTTHVHDFTTYANEFGVPGVTARIGDHSGIFQWLKQITTHMEEGAGGELLRFDRILVNWAVMASDDNMVGFDSLHRRDELHFQIDHSKGVVKVEPNDGAAFTEYRRRCESLGSESAIRPTPS